MMTTPRVAAILGYLAHYAAIGASFPYLSVLYAERGLDLATIGLMTALGAGSGLATAPFWGVLADRFAGSPLVIPAAALTTAAGALMLAVADGVIGLAVAVGIMAGGLAGIGPMLDARALETVGSDRDRWSRLRLWGSASFIVTVVLTGAIIERAGAASIVPIYVAMMVAVAVVTLPLRGASGADRLARLTAIGVVLRHRPLARFLVAALLVWSAAMSLNWYFSIHLLNLGAPGWLVGSAWAIGALVEIPVMATYPWLATRVGNERLLVIGAAVFALRALTLAVATDPFAAAATMVLHGAAFALVLVGGVTYVARHVPAAAATTAQAILSATVFSVAMIIGPPAGSWMAEGLGVTGMFLGGTAASLAGIGAVWLAIRGPSADAPPLDPAVQHSGAGTP